MSKQKMKVTLQILENTYPLMCEPHERNLLIEAAEQLNATLLDMRRDNPKVPLERLVILGALQMAYDLLQERQTIAREVTMVNQVSERLIKELDQAIDEENLSEI
ncbi:MAG: cell division protein ZapA [Cardiobacteriaceae bacterium]|nr:cell division protein ZapA [Cardiobacteriaceae bacterium]